MSVDVAELQIKIGANGVDKAKRDLDGLTSSGKKAESATNLLTSAMRGLAAGLASIGIGVTVRELIQLADQYTNLSGRVRLVTGSTAAATSAMNDLYAISQRTRVGLSSTVDLYTSLSRSTQALGVSQAQVKQITETINQALIVSGTSAAAASGSLAQLGQAFASGALRGDELNSIMEGMPRVAQAIADGMGITVGKLRELGAEGKLTAAEIAKALLSQADAVGREFGQMGVTVDQAMTKLSNAVLMFVGYLNEASGASSSLAGVISTLTDQVRNLQDAMDAATRAIADANGGADDLRVTVVSLSDVVRVGFEAMVVLGANVAYVFQQIVGQIESAYIQASKFLQLDFKGAEAERQRHLQASDAARAGVDAFSESMINGGKAASNLSAYLNENTESTARKAAMDRASAAAADAQWGTTRKLNTELGDTDKKTKKAAKAHKDLTVSVTEADEAALRFISSMERESAQSGRSASALTILEAKTQAALAPTQELADRIMEVAQVRAGQQYRDEMNTAASGIQKFTERASEAIEAAKNMKSELELAAEKMSKTFGDVYRSVDDIYFALKNNDWGAAVSGMIKAFKAVQAAYKQYGVGGAVGSVAGAVAPYTSGKTQSVLGGVAAGAQIGSLIPGVGTAIGAVVGGVLGLFGGSNKAKKEAAQKAAIDAYLKQIEAMNARRELELQLMEAQGRSSEALALRRADELAAMDAASAAIQAQIYALNDQAEAAAKAADVLTKAQAEGDALIAIAKNDLAAAYEREASALQDTIDTFSALAKSLSDYGKSLAAQTSANVSPLVAYRSARGAFSSTSALAATGDVGALGELQAVSQAYLEAAKAVSPDARTYARALAEVRNSVKAAEKYAKDQVSNAEEQLATLKTVVGTLLTINQSVLSVRDAIAALAVAQAQAAQIMATAQAANAAAAASVTAPKVWSATGYAAANPDVASWAQGIIGTKGYDGKVISSVDEALSYHWMNHGKFEGRGFATGGSFTVGGRAGVDQNVIPLNLTRGEMVNVSRQDNMAKVAALLERNNALQEKLIAETAAARRATEKTEQFWRGVTNDGRSINTAAAA